MEALFLSKKDVKLVGEALNALQVELMRKLNDTYHTTFMYAKPEEVREAIYSQMDDIDLMLDRIGYWEVEKD